MALAALAMPPLAGHAAGFGNHSLALTSGVAHTWAAAAWGGGLLALAVHAWRGDRGVAVSARRFQHAGARRRRPRLALSGVGNAVTRMDTFSDLWNSGYGRLVIVKTIIFALLVVAAAYLRRKLLPQIETRRRNVVGLVGLELGLLALAAGLRSRWR